MSPKNTYDQTAVKENKTKFNIADVVILVIIASIIIAFGLRIYNIFGIDQSVQKVRVTFEVEGISSENVSLTNGAVLYTVDGDEKAGVLESFTVSDCVTYVPNEAGELVPAKILGKSTVTGTIVLECIKTDHGFYLGDTLLTVNKTLSLYTAEREMNFKISAIEEVEEPLS
jgi:hypothetical protein